MQSSSNRYLSNLDHLRAVAAFMVFLWHFVHFSRDCPNALCEGMFDIKIPGFSLLEQGYSGVALFMCISGYIFTYLTFGKKLHLRKFWFNRFLRLFPLVLFWGITESLALFDHVMAGDTDRGQTILGILYHIFHPQGAWTIYIELGYYIALPFILIGIKKWGPNILGLVLLALVVNRFVQWWVTGHAQELSYWTVWGHADQFVLGTAAFYIEQWVVGKAANPKRALSLMGLGGLALVLVLYQFVKFGTDSVLWVFVPSVEGLGYGLVIIAYLQYSVPKLLDKPLSALGRWSYSIYLNHFQFLPFLFYIATSRFGMGMDFYQRLLIGTFVIFPLLIPYCALSYWMIEKPFLRLRKNYLMPDNSAKTP